MLATGPESVRMIYDWLFEPESMARPEFDLDHYVALWDLTNRQDARNCEWQQEGLHARPLAHGNFVPQESGCHQFNQWVLESLGERAALAPAPATAEAWPSPTVCPRLPCPRAPAVGRGRGAGRETRWPPASTAR